MLSDANLGQPEKGRVYKGTDEVFPKAVRESLGDSEVLVMENILDKAVDDQTVAIGNAQKEGIVPLRVIVVRSADDKGTQMPLARMFVLDASDKEAPLLAYSTMIYSKEESYYEGRWAERKAHYSIPRQSFMYRAKALLLMKGDVKELRSDMKGGLQSDAANNIYLSLKEDRRFKDLPGAGYRITLADKAMAKQPDASDNAQVAGALDFIIIEEFLNNKGFEQYVLDFAKEGGRRFWSVYRIADRNKKKHLEEGLFHYAKRKVETKFKVTMSDADFARLLGFPLQGQSPIKQNKVGGLASTHQKRIILKFNLKGTSAEWYLRNISGLPLLLKPGEISKKATRRAERKAAKTWEYYYQFFGEILVSYLERDVVRLRGKQGFYHFLVSEGLKQYSPEHQAWKMNMELENLYNLTEGNGRLPSEKKFKATAYLMSLSEKLTKEFLNLREQERKYQNGDLADLAMSGAILNGELLVRRESDKYTFHAKNAAGQFTSLFAECEFNHIDGMIEFIARKGVTPDSGKLMKSIYSYFAKRAKDDKTFFGANQIVSPKTVSLQKQFSSDLEVGFDIKSYSWGQKQDKIIDHLVDPTTKSREFYVIDRFGRTADSFIVNIEEDGNINLSKKYLKPYPSLDEIFEVYFDESRQIRYRMKGEQHDDGGKIRLRYFVPVSRNNSNFPYLDKFQLVDPKTGEREYRVRLNVGMDNIVEVFKINLVEGEIRSDIFEKPIIVPNGDRLKIVLTERGFLEIHDEKTGKINEKYSLQYHTSLIVRGTPRPDAIHLEPFFDPAMAGKLQESFEIYDEHVNAVSQIMRAVAQERIPRGLPLILFDQHSDNNWPMPGDPYPVSSANWLTHLQIQKLIGGAFWVYPEGRESMLDEGNDSFMAISANLKDILTRFPGVLSRGVILSFDLDYFASTGALDLPAHFPKKKEVAKSIKNIFAVLKKYRVPIYLVNGAYSAPLHAPDSYKEEFSDALTAEVNKYDKTDKAMAGVVTNESILNSGARLLSSIEKTQSEEMRAKKEVSEVFMEKESSVMGYRVVDPEEDKGWSVFSGSNLKRIQGSIGLDISEFIEKARKDPNKLFTWVDWGCGDASAMDEIATLLDAQNIKNVRLVAYSNAYTPEWEKVHKRVTFILDAADNLYKYFENEEIDLIYSHYGLSASTILPVTSIFEFSSNLS